MPGPPGERRGGRRHRSPPESRPALRPPRNRSRDATPRRAARAGTPHTPTCSRGPVGRITRGEGRSVAVSRPPRARQGSNHHHGVPLAPRLTLRLAPRKPRAASCLLPARTAVELIGIGIRVRVGRRGSGHRLGDDFRGRRRRRARWCRDGSGCGRRRLRPAAGVSGQLRHHQPVRQVRSSRNGLPIGQGSGRHATCRHKRQSRKRHTPGDHVLDYVVGARSG